MGRITANGLEFEYDEIGPKDGEAIVLVMGFGAQMIRWSDSFRQGLADEGYRVIRFDNRDTGLSQQLDDKGVPDMAAITQKTMAGEDAGALVAYSLEDMAADVAGIIDALDAKPAHVVGASMGGMIVQLVGLNHPEHVRSITPVMTTSGDPELPPATPDAMAALMTPPNSMAREDVVAQGTKAQQTIGSDESVRDSVADIGAGVAASFDRAYRPMGTMRQYAAIMTQPRWHDRLADISAPTMVVHGKSDPLIPIEGGRDVARRVPGAKMVEIESWGHDFPAAMVPKLVETIVTFLAEQKAGAV